VREKPGSIFPTYLI